LQLDLKNSIPLSLENDEIILVSAINQKTRQEVNSFIVAYLFPSSKVSGKSWKAVKLSLPSCICATKYKIQSCIVMSNYIYCSLLLPEVGAYIYKFGLASLQQHQKEMHDIVNISPEHSWQVGDPNLQNCFLSLLKEKIIAINFHTANGKSIIEVKRLATKTSVVSPTKYKFGFPYMVKIITASVIPDDQEFMMVVVYHDSTTDNCCIKNITMPM